MYALVDCNNFYASCERLFRPSLRNEPIVVLSNNDGCVISRSNEAKALGVPMGAPAFKYKELLESKNIHVFSSNYALYGDMSNRVMNLLTSYTPDIEIYSIDEAFLQFKGFENFDLLDYNLEIQRNVTKSTGIPISIGVAPTKTLAKVASKIAKKFPEQTKGVYIIDSEEKRIKALKWLKIGDIWGIGRQHAIRLQNIGVNTAFDFIQLNENWVRKNMAVVGVRLKYELEGKSAIALEEIKAKKAIATTRTFDKMHTNIEDVLERVSTFAATCAEKLRRQKSHCNVIMVFVHTNGHREDLPQYSRNIVLKTLHPTNSSIELVKYTQKALKEIFREGYQYKKAGVIVSGITPANTPQLSFFDNENPKHAKLMKVMDQVNRDLGQEKIKLACQALDRKWKMRQEKLSPRYTTRLDEIITINC